MKTLEEIIGESSPTSILGAIKMLGVAKTILSHEDPEDYFGQGPVVEILRAVIKALQYCDGGEPINRLRLELGNGEVEEAAGDVDAVDASRQSTLSCTQASTITDHLEAIEDFADTLVVSVAPSVEMHDKVLGGSVHRLAREIISRLEAIEELRHAEAATA